MVATIDIEVLPGLRRKARRTADGEWIIPDVPIFGTGIDERDPDDIFEIDRGWLERALARAETDARAGYLPPLHVGHTTQKRRVEKRDPAAVGHFFARSIKPVEVDGETIDAIFADLVIPNEAHVREFESGAYPFRSAEIWDHREPCIDSLALLASEPPFFRFGRLIVSRAPTEFHGRARDGARAAYFSLRGATMMDTKEDETTMADGETPSTDKPGWVDDLFAMLAMIIDGLGLAKAEDEPAAETAEMSQSPAAPASFARAAPELERLDGERDGLRAALSALQRDFSAMKREAKLERRVAELATGGFGADIIKSFRARAEAKSLDAAEHWLEGVSTFAPADPPSAREFLGRSISTAAEPAELDPPEVDKYRSQGPAKLAKARELARSYAKTRPDQTLERYLEINIDPHAFMERVRRR